MILGLILGALAVLVPCLFYVARVLEHATKRLSEAVDLHERAQRLFENAKLLRSDEERVAELAFLAWSLERRCDAAVEAALRFKREAATARRVPRLLWALAGVGAAVIVLLGLRWIG